MLGRVHETGVGLPANASEALRLYRLAVQRAPYEAYAMAPWLALNWLRARMVLAPLLRLLGPLSGALHMLLPPSPAAPLADGAGGGQPHFHQRVPSVVPAWDTLLIAAMVGVLTLILWRKRQLQQRDAEGGAAPAAGQAASAAAATPQPPGAPTGAPAAVAAAEAVAEPEAAAPEPQPASAAAAAAERRQAQAGHSSASDATVEVGLRQRAHAPKAEDAEPGSRL